MTKIKTIQKWVTADGREHATEQEADHHQQCLDIMDNFRKACRLDLWPKDGRDTVLALLQAGYRIVPPGAPTVEGAGSF